MTHNIFYYNILHSGSVAQIKIIVARLTYITIILLIYNILYGGELNINYH